MRVRRRGGGAIIFLLVYVLFGLYFINQALEFFVIPETFLLFEKWMNLIGGVLIIIGGINYLRIGRYHV
jgi:uncharacterized membrane protein YuzA (DUF378 family)